MSDNNDIRPGDLVIVKSCHCGESTRWLGRIFTVGRLGISPTDTGCNGCGALLPNTPFATNADDGGMYPRSTLKRIPPLDEMEGEDRDAHVPVTEQQIKRIKEILETT